MSIFEKIKMYFTGEEYDDYNDDYDDNYVEEREERPINNVTSFYNQDKRSSSATVNVSAQMGICMINPKSLEEAAEACAELKRRNVVVINLEEIDLSISQKISDFLSGVVYALDGSIQLISNKIIIIAPVNVEMSGELKDQLKASGIKISNAGWR